MHAAHGTNVNSRCHTVYENEAQCGEGVARAIKDGIVKREDLFIVSKLWNNFHDGDKVEPICRRQLKDWQIDYFDLYLMHFPISLEYVDPAVQYPPPDGPEFPPGKASVYETYRAMEKLVDAGLTKAIGVSNFNGGLMLDLLHYARIKPATLQIEHHPYLTQETLVKYVQGHDIVVTAYSSFGPSSYLDLDDSLKGTPLLLDHPLILELAKKYHKTPAQILLRWSTQRNVTVIPKTGHPERLAQNLAVTDFDMDEESMKKISALNSNLRFNEPMKASPLSLFCDSDLY